MSFLRKMLGGAKNFTLLYMDDHFRFEREALMGELCGHLHVLGVNAELLEPDSPEAFRFPWYALGCVKIKDRNLDVILVQYSSSGGGSDSGPDETHGMYFYFYVTRASVGGLESELKADFKPKWRDRCCLKRGFRWLDQSLIGEEIPACSWEGGKLAKLLNDDSSLTRMLFSEGLDSLEVRPDRSRRCVRILHMHWWRSSGGIDRGQGDYKDIYDGSVPGGTYLSTVGRKQFPTRGAFEVFDRIAFAVRSLAMNNSVNSRSGV